MIDRALTRLRDLAQKDPAVAPLAILQAEALSASADPSWERAVPTYSGGRLPRGVPLLHAQVLPVDAESVARLLQHLSKVASEASPAQVDPLRRALGSPEFDSLELLHASITAAGDRMARLAAWAGVQVELLSVVGHLASLPLLRACGRRAAPLLEGQPWQHGFCPVCAAWPTLAEMRGLERQRWLRCGRCGAGWQIAHQRCAYCGNDDHVTLGYLAADAERETRRAETCDRCHAYLKTFATLAALDPAEVGLQDLTTLELDVAALERGYSRPERPGFELQVRLEPARGNGRLRS